MINVKSLSENEIGMFSGLILLPSFRLGRLLENKIDILTDKARFES